MSSTDLIQPGDDSNYLVLSMPPTELNELIASNLDPGQTVSIKDLRKIKVPAAGATTWEIPTIDGGRADKELRGVIIRKDPGRAYYVKPYDGSNDPPDCASTDMLTGHARLDEDGKPTGVKWTTNACADCPFNEFGTAANGVGKACSEFQRLFILPQDGLLPYIVKIPAGSLAHAKSFFFGLIDARLKPWDVEVVLRLEKAKNETGIDYAKVVFEVGQRLSPEARAHIQAYSAFVAPQMDRAAAEDDRDDSGAASAAKAA